MDDIWGASSGLSPGGTEGCEKVQLVKDTIEKLRNSSKKTDPWIELVLLMADFEEGDEELTTFSQLLENVKDVNSTSKTGFALIHYTIVYNHAAYIELLHDRCYGHNLDLNLLDRKTGFSPLMWSFQLERATCCIELFSFIDELQFDLKNKDGLSSWDLVVPGSSFEAFLDQNNILQYKSSNRFSGSNEQTATAERALGDEPNFDKLDLQIAGMTLASSEVFSENRATDSSSNGNIFPEFLEDFEFDRLVKYQYLEFADYDIPQILDLLISLPQKFPHITTYPAALLFQCARYADHKLESKPLVESLMHLSLTRIISAVSSELVPDVETTGDIVIQSYWLSAVSFLYYYFCRDDSFFKRYPSILQELINGMHTLMMETTSSIHSRLLPLIDPTIIAYTTIDVVKQTLYKRDWNFFKKRKQLKNDQAQEKRKNSVPFYDSSMLKHLYPPSLEEQMKLSPMKVVQVFGALAYVLELHQSHPLFQQQCLSLSINWFASALFNKILKNKKKKTLSRAHAIQIRLNLSNLEAWIKNNDLIVPKPNLIDDFMWERFPYTLVCDLGQLNLADPPLRNVATYKPVKQEDPSNDVPLVSQGSNSLFFYQPFHRIAQIHFEPVFELLQWLQVATTLTNDESLDATMKLLPALSPHQLLKAIDKYNYETEEHKFNSSLRRKLSNSVKTQITNADPYLPERPTPLMALPTIAELTDAYSRGANSRSFQPLLPIDIQDSVYEIHDDNMKLRRNETFMQQGTSDRDKDEDRDTQSQSSGASINRFTTNADNSQTADEYFKELDAPMATAHRQQWTNDEIEANPW